jgi:hypothetical protein
MREDGFDRAVEAKLALKPAVSTYRDANERTATASQREPLRRGLSDFGQSFSQIAAPLQPSRVDGYLDAPDRALPVAGPAEVSTVSSSRELEWPQIGVGFGVGILFALGLLLAFRHTRIRPPLAQ